METIQWTLEFMSGGGIFMWIILAVWCCGIAISLERWLKYMSYHVDGQNLLAFIRKSIVSKNIPEAVAKCTKSSALICLVMRSGLERADQTKEEIQDGLEGSILEVVPLIQKRLSFLALMANLSTLLGLLGTIQGLIQSFAAVAQAEASQKAQLLAEGIAVAMNTTALGLVSAISLMVVHSFLTSKGEQMIQDIEENSSKLIDLLNTKNSANSNNRAA
jgi:biopolymer transport protein ExbB